MMIEHMTNTPDSSSNGPTDAPGYDDPNGRASPPPVGIRAHRDKRVLELEWPKGKTSRLPFKPLRCLCPCAGCVDEFTGIRTLDVNAVPEDVAPVELGYSGNYALKIRWSDGHSTGIYTWRYLAEICALAEQNTRPSASDA